MSAAATSPFRWFAQVPAACAGADPHVRVCSCIGEGGAVDDMELVPMADVPATVATFTIDRLAYSLAPTIAVVIDFDAG